MLKKLIALSMMWWIVGTATYMVSGPTGHRVRLMIGPWDTEYMCNRVLDSGDQDIRNDTSVFMNVHCAYYQDDGSF
jgi:hypothetical protein